MNIKIILAKEINILTTLTQTISIVIKGNIPVVMRSKKKRAK